MKEHKPDIVLCPYPHDVNSTHELISKRVAEAVYHCKTGGYDAHANGVLPEMYLFYYQSPMTELPIRGTHVCDISEFFDQKIEIFKTCYKSQSNKEFLKWVEHEAGKWGYKAGCDYGEAFVPSGIAKILIS